MGLDMYLYKKTYVRQWEWVKAEDRYEVTVTKGGKPCTEIKGPRIRYIEEEVAYWRKANAIHKWFVDNVQDGEDDCGDYNVSREQLGELVELCKRVIGCVETIEGKVKTGTSYYPDGKVVQHEKDGPVITNKAMAADLLPTVGGFFFGGTEYDEFYMQDLKETIKQIEPLLSEEEGDGDYYYHSSW